MKRRDFIAAAGAAAATPMVSFAGVDPVSAPDGRQYIELQQYHLLYGSKQGLVHDYLENAAIPAYNRLGINPVGVFQVVYGQNAPSLYVLLPHSSLESVVTTSHKLLADEEYVEQGAAFVNASMSDPAFVRMENTLLYAFESMPGVAVPPQKAAGKPRIFEMRTYESHSEKAAKNKLEMFNGGEVPIFRKTGLTPVFFGEAVVGSHMPHLTYMLVFDDMEARDAAWKAFSADPDWAKLAKDPRYQDNVSAISDIILRPTGYSQL
ncbi:MAG TPA: NIPSNAP family protein [Rhodothermales bacterium]|nr:NIPSNAP family protein [Rhodothermales bacterium]